MREIRLKRVFSRLPADGIPGYCAGCLIVDGQYICDTLEGPSLGLRQSTPLSQIARVKAAWNCAIPAGRYRVMLGVRSPRFCDVPFYRDVCGGCVPRLLQVPGWAGILIHCGNKPADTRGCILVGDRNGLGRLVNSGARFRDLMQVLRAPSPSPSQLFIDIIDP